MNVLIMGGANDLTGRLVDSFNKEGHRVSVLTGSYHRNVSYERAFEQYNFPYDSNNLTEIFESVSPDITVFTGSQDSNFNLRDVQSDSVAFITATMNTLVSFSIMGKGRLVFISSDLVFDPTFSTPRTEEDRRDAGDLSGMTMIEAEDLCEKFRAGFGSDIVTVRLSGYYHLPASPDDISDVVGALCLERLQTGSLSDTLDRKRMLIHASDASFFITRIALAPQVNHSIYHLSSGQPVDERELAALVEREAQAALASRKRTRQRPGTVPRHDPIEDFAVLGHGQAMLSIERFESEFGINRLSDLHVRVRETIGHMLRHDRLFLLDEADTRTLRQRVWAALKYGGKALLPYVENVAVFLVFHLLVGFTAQSAFFARVDLYLLYVLLFAILYGQAQAAVSAFLALAGLVTTEVGSGGGVGALLDYSTYVWAVEVFVVGLSVGYLKDHLSEQKAEALDDHEYMVEQLENIQSINDSNSRVKDALEIQLINHENSLGKIYGIVSGLNSYQSVEVLFRATDAIRRTMETNDVAVYVVHSTSPYARMFTATSDRARRMGNSFLYAQTGEMYEAIRQRRTYINHTWDPERPAMAVGVYEEDKLEFIVMVWTLPLEKMTQGEANMLMVLCMLMENNTMVARRYYEAVREKEHVEGTNVMLPHALRRFVEQYDQAVESGLTEYVVLRVYLTEDGIKDTAERLMELLRPNDFLGQGQRDDAIYAIISNTSMSDADVIIKRLAGSGLIAVVAQHDLI